SLIHTHAETSELDSTGPTRSLRTKTSCIIGSDCSPGKPLAGREVCATKRLCPPSPIRRTDGTRMTVDETRRFRATQRLRPKSASLRGLDSTRQTCGGMAGLERRAIGMDER